MRSQRRQWQVLNPRTRVTVWATDETAMTAPRPEKVMAGAVSYVQSVVNPLCTVVPKDTYTYVRVVRMPTRSQGLAVRRLLLPGPTRWRLGQ